jgi:molecular chaperone GrpE
MANEMNETPLEEAVLEPAADEIAADGADEGTEEEAGPPTLEEQLAVVEAEVADYKDRWLRSQAEFANARKRMEKQRIDTYANATVDVLRKMLPVMDDFDRAMEALPPEMQEDSWSEGITLVYKKLQMMLEGFNVIPIDSVGIQFDPNLHEAISQEASDEYESGVVMKELQRGYLLGERVIRPSMVIVAA